MKTDNELIAEFMNVERCSDKAHSHDPCFHYEHLGGYITSERMKYHSSWDWLMPVVEKIDNLENGKYIITIDPMITIISENGENVIKECQAFDGRIKNTYCAIVEFIKWHNSQK